MRVETTAKKRQQTAGRVAERGGAHAIEAVPAALQLAGLEHGLEAGHGAVVEVRAAHEATPLRVAARAACALGPTEEARLAARPVGLVGGEDVVGHPVGLRVERAVGAGEHDCDGGVGERRDGERAGLAKVGGHGVGRCEMRTRRGCGVRGGEDLGEVANLLRVCF